MSTRIVAIDGPAGSGKSTVARALAKEIGWSYLDTGAMYRALTAQALYDRIDLDDEASMATFARNCTLETLPRVVINGRDVEDEIRTDVVNRGVSIIAAQPQVRHEMVLRQRAFADCQPRGTVVEGRDITTVVFPEATLKVFLTATLEERSRRRGDEGMDSVARRDEADATRDASPLRQAADAVYIDTTGRAIEDIVKEITECLSTRN